MKGLDSFLSFLLMIGIASFPVYVFPSGSLQPSHMLIASFSFLVFLRHRFLVTSWGSLFLVFCYWSFVIEASYTILGQSPSWIINAIFFIFNWLAACAVYRFCVRDGLAPVAAGITIAALIAIIAVMVTGFNLRDISITGRATGTFNNPNQLGFFSVCLLSITFLMYRTGHFSYWHSAALFGVAIFLSILSLSKAAMIANAAVVLIAMKPANSKFSFAIWSGSLVVTLSILAVLFLRGYFDEYMFLQRLSGLRQEDDSSLASRGYFAIFQGNSIQLLVGIGAERVHRIVGHEVHSTFASVANLYGLIGLTLFGSIFLIWAVRLKRTFGFGGLLCIAMPSLLYGVTHNGTRFTIFWLLFAVSLAAARRCELSRQDSRLKNHPKGRRSSTANGMKPALTAVR